jgi:hypothetical protein
LPQVQLPYLFTTDLGSADVGAVASALAAQIERLAG